jgi:hypothetical protein
VLEKSLGQFGDQLYIKHSPMLQQEGQYQCHNAEAVTNKLQPMPRFCSWPLDTSTANRPSSSP